jgi:DNA-binding CsgD family transcriptional regulator
MAKRKITVEVQGDCLIFRVPIRILVKAAVPSPDDVVGNLTLLTPKEREVFALLREGKCNKEIAAAMHISVRTVVFHTPRIYQKLAIGREDILRMYGKHPLA